MGNGGLGKRLGKGFGKGLDKAARAFIALALCVGTCACPAQSWAASEGKAESPAAPAASLAAQAGDAASAKPAQAAGDPGSSATVLAARSSELDGMAGSASRAAYASAAASSDPQADAGLVGGIAVGNLLARTPALREALYPQAGEVDLNAVWKSQDGGTASTLSIVAGGTYVLSSDFTGESGIVVNAPDQDVVIDLAQHKFELTGAGGSRNTALMRILAARSVTLKGACASSSLLVAKGSSAIWGVSLESRDTALSLVDVAIRLAPQSNALSELGLHCVRAIAGSVEATRANFEVDLGNQTLITGMTAATEVTSAVFATQDISRLRLTDCSANAVGSPSFALADPAAAEGLGMACALYSQAASTVVSGGTYSASSALGTAIALSASQLNVEGSPVTTQASAAQLAAGIAARTRASATIAAPLAFSQGDVKTARWASALFSTVDDAFVLADSGLPAQPLAVLVATGDLEDANGQKTLIATSAANSSKTAQWAASLSNALGEDAPCAVAAQGSSLRFRLDPSRAVARISEERFATTSEALSAFSDGDTLVALSDLGALEITKVRDGAIDLNGHSIQSLAFATRNTSATAPGLSVRNGSIVSVRESEQGPCAVLYNATCPLSLEQVEISVAANDDNVAAIYAPSTSRGQVRIDGCRIAVALSRQSNVVTGYGVRVDRSSRSKVVMSGTAVDLAAASGAVSLCAIQALASCDIDQSTVSVAGTNLTAGAIQAAGTVSVSDTRIDVRTTAQAPSAYGLWALSSRPAADSVHLDGTSIDVRCSAGTADGGYWCLRNATVASERPATTWTLDGACTFRSSTSTHFGLNLGRVTIGDSFAFGPQTDSVVTLSQQRLDDDLAFVPAGSRSLSSLASRFAPLAGSAYEGWRLASTSEGLVWANGNAASGAIALERAGSTVATFDHLDDAIGQARPNDTLKLTRDCAQAGSVVMDKGPLTLDLAGHTLAIRAGADARAQANGTGAALDCRTGGQTLAVMSSAGAAKLDLQVGAPTESSDGVTYQGIALSGDSTLVLGRSCTASVSYTGGAATAIERTVNVRGIHVSAGTLQLEGALEVDAPAPAGAFPGPIEATGVLVEPLDGATARLVQAPASRVEVRNATPARVRDAVAAPTDDAMSRGTNAAVREIHPDENADAAFYQALQDQFLVSALYDKPDDYNPDSAYGASIYYTQGFMRLSEPGAWYDGLKVLAYSDVVAASDVGKRESVKAAHFFVPSAYDVLPSARGIATAAKAGGTADVQVNGSVAVRAPAGEACALDAAGEGSVSWSGSVRSVVSQGDSKPHFVYGSRLDLRDYIEFDPAIDEVVVYNGNLGKLVPLASLRTTRVQEAAVAAGVSFGVAGVASAGASEQLDAPYPQVNYTGYEKGIEVVFANAYDEQGMRKPDLSIRAEEGQTLKEALADAHASLPSAADYRDASRSTSARFIGWGVFSGGSEPTASVFDPSDEQMTSRVVLDSTLSGVASGKVVLWAVYVEVGPSQHLVTFKADHYCAAYAADDGAVPDYPSADPSATSYSVPQKPVRERGSVYTFEGWKDASGKLVGVALPPVRADAVYSASYQAAFAPVSLSFNLYRKDATNSQGYSRSTKLGSTTFDKPLQNVVDQLVSEVGDPFEMGSQIYTLRGWTLRATDVDPVFDGARPLPSGLEDPAFISSLSFTTVLYAVYGVSDHYVDVEFYDGETLLGEAHVTARTTLDAAFAKTGAKRPADRSETEVFSGWATSADASDAHDPTSTMVASLVEPTGGKLALYAAYGDNRTFEVSFYDSDRRHVISEVYVARGRSVEAVLQEKGAAIPMPQVEAGTYFAGWQTASGAAYALGEPVTGQASLYPRFAPVQVSSLDPADINAQVTCTASGLEQAQSMIFSLRPTPDADRPLRERANALGYSLLKSYSMQLAAKFPDATTRYIGGDFGTADIAVYVGSAYKDSMVRLLWTNARDAASISALKEVDAQGYVHVSIPDYSMGDVDEGGNLTVGYVEGGSANSGVALGAGGLSNGLAAGLGGVSLSGNAAPGQPSAQNALSSPLARAGAVPGDGEGALTAQAADGAGEGAFDGEEAPADPVSLAVLLVVLAACIARFIWWMFAKRTSLDDDESDDVEIGAGSTVGGIRF